MGRSRPGHKQAAPALVLQAIHEVEILAVHTVAFVETANAPECVKPEQHAGAGRCLGIDDRLHILNIQRSYAAQAGDPPAQAPQPGEGDQAVPRAGKIAKTGRFQATRSVMNHRAGKRGRGLIVKRGHQLFERVVVQHAVGIDHQQEI